MTINQIQQNVNEAKSEESYSNSAKLCRDVLAMAVDYIYEKSGAQKPKNASLLELIDNSTVISYINDADIINSLHYIRILGMNAQHGRSIRKEILS